MNAQEKLKRIKAKCQELLAIAEKRTPGKWSHAAEYVGSEIAHYVTQGPVLNVCLDTDKADAQYIASCVGPAEAGWRAAIVAIEGLLLIATEGQEPERGSACFDLGKILAAWPDEIL